MYLHLLPPNKKNVPELIKDPVPLIQDVRTLIGLHRQDNRELAITGRPILTGKLNNNKHLDTFYRIESQFQKIKKTE